MSISNVSTVVPKNYISGTAAQRIILIGDRRLVIQQEIHWQPMRTHERIGTVINGRDLTLSGLDNLGRPINPGGKTISLALLNEDIGKLIMPESFLCRSLQNLKDGNKELVLLIQGSFPHKTLSTNMMVFYDAVDPQNRERIGIILLNG